MKNIMHLEDTVFFHRPEELMELMAALTLNLGAKQNIGSLTIKYDGTCMVFGKRHNEFFISDKGYFNKKPRMLFSEDDIHKEKWPDDKKRKFLHAFNVLKTTGIRDGLTLYADWLFDEYTIDYEDRSFQPNITRYMSKRPLHQSLGLAVHSQDFCGYETASMWTANCATRCREDIYFAPTQLELMSREPLSNYNHLFLLAHSLDFRHWNADDDIIKEMRSGLNGLVRTREDYKFTDLNKIFGHFYTNLKINLDVLIRFKYTLLDHLDSIALEQQELSAEIAGEQLANEGYVFRYNGHKVKLVDRYKFSKKNFDRNISRGFDVVQRLSA